QFWATVPRVAPMPFLAGLTTVIISHPHPFARRLCETRGSMNMSAVLSAVKHAGYVFALSLGALVFVVMALRSIVKDGRVRVQPIGMIVALLFLALVAAALIDLFPQGR